MRIGNRSRLPGGLLPASVFVLEFTVLVAGCSGEIAPGTPFSTGHTPDAPGADSAAIASAGTASPSAGSTAPRPMADAGSQPQPPAASACAPSETDVGATPLQRLSRLHYANAVRDLLEVEVPLDQLPEDEKFGAFDGNIAVPVTELLVEQYAGAAEQAARLALPAIAQRVPCDRAADGDGACARRFIEAFGRRAYRRPLESDEVERYEALFSAFEAKGYEDALRVVAQTMLQSPNFLYRVELQPSAAVADEMLVPLDAYEVASRLSFFLLSTTPDDALLDAAGSGALLDPDTLAIEVDRLLRDPRLSETLARFHLQWLELEGLDRLTKDEELFPAFTQELGAAMRDETLRFIEHVWLGDRATFASLMTAPYSFPEGALLDIYGLPEDSAADDGEPIALDPAQRAGLLTQPSFLASHAHFNQTSPVLRGKVVIRNVLCQPLPDPPPNVNATPPEPSPDATTRERLLAHQNDPSCAGCHQMIDGIGFGFENFDAIGAFRSREAGKTIDASGEILGTASSDGPFDGAVELAHAIADSSEAQQCFAKQWLRFALGRPDVAADRCTIETLHRDFTESGGDLRGLLRAIALSPAFRSKRVVEAGP